MVKASKIIIAGIIMVLSLSNSGYDEIYKASGHRDNLFNSGWKFLRDTLSGAEKPVFDDSRWIKVDLPHD